MIAAGFSWFHLIPAVDHNELIGGLGHMDSVHLHAWLVVVLLLGGALLARRGLAAASARTGVERYATDDRLTPRVVAEAIVEMWQDAMGRLMGPADVRIFLPIIASVFCYIFASNLLGVVPGLLPPTENTSATVGMAIASFLLFNAVGLWRDPVGYVKHIFGPVWWLAPLMFPVEVLSLLIRPFALMVRLSGNLYGDHKVFTNISDLVPWWLPGPVIPLIMLALLVSTVQAFVFSMLSTVYIGLAMPHHDSGDAHGHDAH